MAVGRLVVGVSWGERGRQAGSLNCQFPRDGHIEARVPTASFISKDAGCVNAALPRNPPAAKQGAGLAASLYQPCHLSTMDDTLVNTSLRHSTHTATTRGLLH